MDKLQKNPVLFLGLAIALIFGAVWLVSDSVQVSVQRGVDFALGGETNLDQLSLNSIDVNSNVATSTNPRHWESNFVGNIGAGSQAGFFKSPFNHGERGTIFITDAWVTLVGDSSGVLNASSTFFFDISTSTEGRLVEVQTLKGGALGEYSSSTPLEPPTSYILDSVYIATSTATSTSSALLRNSVSRLIDGVDSSDVPFFDRHSSPVRLLWDEYVVGVLTEDGHGAAAGTDNVVCNPDFNPSPRLDINSCESATSTSRGFDLIWGFTWYSTTTPPVTN